MKTLHDLKLFAEYSEAIRSSYDEHKANMKKEYWYIAYSDEASFETIQIDCKSGLKLGGFNSNTICFETEEQANCVLERLMYYGYISGEGWGVRKVHVLHEAMFRNLNDMGKLMTSGTKAKMIIDIVEGLNASKATECISIIFFSSTL